jgi:uracil-DNA glycosylase family 4
MTISVPGYGNKAARIMLVGEAPATTEVRLGMPFMGRAGEELNKLLEAAGIQRKDLYITNASLEPVRGEKAQFFFHKGQPTIPYLQGIGQLINDINDIKPSVVVVMGNYALWALTQETGIMKWRGSILWSELANVKVVPTIHPAAIIRGKPDVDEKGQGGMYKMRNPVIWDLQRAKEQSRFPELRRRSRTYLVNPTGLDEDRAIERLRAATRITFDIESWGGTRLACIGFSDGDPEWSVTFSYDGRVDRRSLYKELLETDVPKITQNGMYDCTMLDQNGIHPKNVWWDTMVASHALLPDLPKSLAFLTSIYTDIPYFKDEGKYSGDGGKIWERGATASDMDKLQYYTYNGKDVCATSEVAQVQEKELEDQGLTHIFRGTMGQFEPYRWATYRGFACDHSKLFELINTSIEKEAIAHKELVELAGREINVGSWQQVQTLLYKERHLAGSKVLSTDAPTILNLAAKTGDRAPYLIIAERRQKKLQSTYYHTGILSSDGRVRFGFNLVGTFGARISSSAPLWGPGLNGQNIPIHHKAKARQMFVADSGYTLLEFDQAQAEAVVVAYLANDPIHMDCFRNNKDVHRVTACLLTGKPTSDWQSIPKPSAIRELAKTCNHELNYNAGPIQFMYTVNEEYDPEDPDSVKLDQATATTIRQTYLRTRPALQAYWDSIKAELKLNRTLVTPFGRPFQFLDQWSQSLLNRAYSYKPQATVGEITSYGVQQVFGIRPSQLVDDSRSVASELARMGLQLLLQVHDSTVWQIPNEAVNEAVPFLFRLLEVPLSVNGYNLIIPIEGAKGSTWYKHDMESLGISRTSCEVGND